MGGSKRHRQREKDDLGEEAHADCKEMCTKSGDDGPKEQNIEDDNGTVAHIEFIGTDESHAASTSCHQTAWTAESVEKIEKISPKCAISSDGTIPSVMDVGLQMVRGTLERISNRKNKKSRKKSTDSSSYGVKVKPTPVQLRVWPSLLGSFESKSSSDETLTALNVVGIAPTGSGNTLQ